jgi:Txe/YoeB family toxin of Txe-Axe toxin-antitoxin module
MKKKGNSLPKGVEGTVFKDIGKMEKLSDQFRHGLDQTSHDSVPV